MLKGLSKTIVISMICSSIFLLFFKPLVEWLWNVIKGFSGTLFEKYVDNTYKTAAYRSDSLTIFYIFLMLMMLSIMVGLVIFLYADNMSKKYKKSKMLESLTEEEREQSEYEEEQKDKIKNQTIYIRLNQLLIGFRIMAVFYLTALIVLVATEAIRITITDGFKQKMIAIAPYIDDQKEEEINSKWALMKTRRDFEVVDSTVNAIAKINKIELGKENF